MTALYYAHPSAFLYFGDCIEAMRSWPECSVDSVVCDPPYGLRFMGKDWDNVGDGLAQQEWHRQWAVEAYRVLKPGGHLVAFGGSRTYHRLASALEDAGFEIRDSLMWLYGSGVPKSLNVSKAIDKVVGAEQRVVRVKGTKAAGLNDADYATRIADVETAAGSDVAEQWEGWGTALKPAYEIAIHAVKPLGKYDTIGSCLSKLCASFVESLSSSSPSAFVAGFVSALRNAGRPLATQGVSSETMATSLCVSDLLSGLSTVLSWQRLWADLYLRESMSIIATESSTTIDLKTLKFCLLKITHAITTLVPENELKSLVATAASLFNVVQQSYGAIHMPAATESATDRLPIDSPAKVEHEPIVLARKPLEGTVAANVMKWGTGALNIDGCRIAAADVRFAVFGGAKGASAGGGQVFRDSDKYLSEPHEAGRWPANVMFDVDAGAMLDEQSGGASRFFYCPKVSRAERDEGCAGLPARTAIDTVERDPESAGAKNPRAGAGRGAGAATKICTKCKKNVDGGRAVQPCEAGGQHEVVDGEVRPSVKNHHPCLKPIALMRWLVRLVTPPGGLVLDPFMGSGSTGVAALLEGCRFIGTEKTPEYLPIAAHRIYSWEKFNK